MVAICSRHTGPRENVDGRYGSERCDGRRSRRAGQRSFAEGRSGSPVQTRGVDGEEQDGGGRRGDPEATDPPAGARAPTEQAQHVDNLVATTVTLIEMRLDTSPLRLGKGSVEVGCDVFVAQV